MKRVKQGIFGVLILSLIALFGACDFFLVEESTTDSSSLAESYSPQEISSSFEEVEESVEASSSEEFDEEESVEYPSSEESSPEEETSESVSLESSNDGTVELPEDKFD
jgi:hypothetical protein